MAQRVALIGPHALRGGTRKMPVTEVCEGLDAIERQMFGGANVWYPSNIRRVCPPTTNMRGFHRRTKERIIHFQFKKNKIKRNKKRDY
jgi:hypothetical protein